MYFSAFASSCTSHCRFYENIQQMDRKRSRQKYLKRFVYKLFFHHFSDTRNCVYIVIGLYALKMFHSWCPIVRGGERLKTEPKTDQIFKCFGVCDVCGNGGVRSLSLQSTLFDAAPSEWSHCYFYRNLFRPNVSLLLFHIFFDVLSLLGESSIKFSNGFSNFHESWLIN